VTTLERRAADFFDRGGGWVLAQLVLLAAAGVVPVWFGGSAGSVGQASRVVGKILMGAGVAVFVLGAANLGKTLTPFPKPLEDGVFRRTGAYRLVRHPIYSGLALAALGFSIFHWSWPGVTVDVVLFLFLDRKASREEKWLLAKYPGYAGYRDQVHKLIPWIY